MAAYQCLFIGINQYHFLQPLRYPKADAQALYQFFAEQLQVSSQNLLLLTDTSAPVEGNPTYPNRDNLQTWLRRQNQPPVSPFWFFFSGYGLHYQGEDYLMPIDGNPQAPQQTGINLREVFTLLQGRIGQGKEIIVILELNCGALVGQQTLTLAQELGIALILFSHPQKNQFPQGILTTALLEAFTYYRRFLTLATLTYYLGDRLATSSNSSPPIVYSPSLAFSSQALLPKLEKEQEKVIPTPPRGESTVTLPQLGRETAFGVAVAPAPPATIEENEPDEQESESSSLSFWLVLRQFKWIWVGIFAAFLLGFCLFYFFFSLFNPALQEREKGEELFNRAKSHLKNNQASSFNRAISQARKIPPQSPVYPEAQIAITRWSQVIFEIAQARAKLEDYHGAIAAARLVPAEPKQVYALARDSIEKWTIQAKQQQKNQIFLEAAFSLIKPHQASSYNRAITLLRQIPPGEPVYPQARKLISQWSENIYLIASARAQTGKFQEAILTAQLVPPDTPTYQKALQAITTWQEKLNP